MAMKKADAIRMAWEMFPAFLEHREKAEQIDTWLRGRQEDSIYLAREATPEFKDLMSKSVNNWASMLVTSVAQTLFLTGMSQPGTEGNSTVWDIFQRNGWDRRQGLLHRAALGHGEAYAYALPSRNRSIPVLRPVSMKRGYAWWPTNDENDEYPMSFIIADREDKDDGTGYGYSVQLLDESARYFLRCNGNGYDIDDWSFIAFDEYPRVMPGAPVARYVNRAELDGPTFGEIEPFIPLLCRIDQDTFDRLIVQRFGAWKVRYAIGLAKPGDDEQAKKMIAGLKASDLLINESTDARFGTLDATDMAGFISARDADLRDLSALSQTPPYQLLGLSANLQAESLAAAREGLELKSTEVKTTFGESHEDLARIGALMAGDTTAANAYDMQCKWRDTDPRSLSQAADAGAKFADSLGIPVQMLWGRLVPGWTDTDTAEALRLIEDGQADEIMSQLQAALAAAGGDPSADPTQQEDPSVDPNA